MKLNASYRPAPWLALLALCGLCLHAQQSDAPVRQAEVTAHMQPPNQSHAGRAHKSATMPPAVIWLTPVQTVNVAPLPPGNFTLLQKNKMFTPHLLVVPVGSSVAFPNADPFFHNVFSLFDGKRFDLGLYEAGSTRSVAFSREGISYIFCNIHSEMSAVVISLATPFDSQADASGLFRIKDVPNGEYELHVWIEGQRQSALDQLTRPVRITGTATDIGEIRADHPTPAQHLNKFGRPYEPETHPIY